MEELNFVLLWKEYYTKIDENLLINKKLLIETLHKKASSSLFRLKTIRRTGIITGILWCIGIGFIVISSWGYSSPIFKISLIVNFLATAIAVFLYIHHLVLLNQFDNSQHVIDAQQKLTDLKVSNLKTLGILWLQLPVFSTWYMTFDWMVKSPLTFWGIQMSIVVLETFIGVWLFRNLNYKNHDKKWFRWFVSKGEFARIEKASNFMKEIEELKKGM